MLTFSTAASGAPKWLLVFLHGLGDVGKSWIDFFPTQSSPYASNFIQKEILMVFPNAPKIPISINGGMVMPGWYDITSLNEPSATELMSATQGNFSSRQDDVEGFDRSAEQLHALLQSLSTRHNIPFENIILGGFSQGGAVALYTTLKYQLQLKGLVILSSYLPLIAYPHLSWNPAKKLSMIWGHGGADPLIPAHWGKLSFDKLSASKIFDEKTFHTYRNMQHSACLEEQNDVIKFINNL